jgi:hypothetical protein
MNRFLILLLSSLIAFSFFACGEEENKGSSETTPSTTEVPNVQGLPSGAGVEATIKVTVSGSTTPKISWEGGPVAYVAVVEYTNNTVGVPWIVVSMTGTNTISSPITYGQVPQDAISMAGIGEKPPDLKAGTNYLVEVVRIKEKDAAEFGIAFFKP